jgi:hypothetical protein
MRFAQGRILLGSSFFLDRSFRNPITSVGIPNGWYVIIDGPGDFRRYPPGLRPGEITIRPSAHKKEKLVLPPSLGSTGRSNFVSKVFCKMRLTRVLRHRRPRPRLNRNVFCFLLIFCQSACQQGRPLIPALPEAFFPLIPGQPGSMKLSMRLKTQPHFSRIRWSELSMPEAAAS